MVVGVGNFGLQKKRLLVPFLLFATGLQKIVQSDVKFALLFDCARTFQPLLAQDLHRFFHHVPAIFENLRLWRVCKSRWV